MRKILKEHNWLKHSYLVHYYNKYLRLRVTIERIMIFEIYLLKNLSIKILWWKWIICYTNCYLVDYYNSCLEPNKSKIEGSKKIFFDLFNPKNNLKLMNVMKAVWVKRNVLEVKKSI